MYRLERVDSCQARVYLQDSLHVRGETVFTIDRDIHGWSAYRALDETMELIIQNTSKVDAVQTGLAVCGITNSQFTMDLATAKWLFDFKVAA